MITSNIETQIWWSLNLYFLSEQNTFLSFQASTFMFDFTEMQSCGRNIVNSERSSLRSSTRDPATHFFNFHSTQSHSNSHSGPLLQTYITHATSRNLTQFNAHYSLHWFHYFYMYMRTHCIEPSSLT